MNSPATDGAATTLDGLLAGGLRLRQPARGHRAGTDAVLLAAFARPPAGGTVVDLGAGVGTVGLILALRDPTLRVLLVERDPAVAELARENAGLNGVADRVRVECRDVFDAVPSPEAHLVVCNPPFHLAGDGRPSPHEARAAAHHLGGRDHAAWLDAVLRHGRSGGAIAMINRAAALPTLLAPGRRRLGGIVVRPVQPRLEAAATRVLVGGTIGGKAALMLLPPLVLHEPDGAFTPEAEQAHRGGTIAADAKKPARRPASETSR